MDDILTVLWHVNCFAIKIIYNSDTALQCWTTFIVTECQCSDDINGQTASFTSVLETLIA